MRNFCSIFKMDLANLVKNPVLVNANTLFPLLLILIMGYLTSGSYARPADAYNYYAVSFLIFGMLNGAMTASNGFMERDIKRPNLRIIYSPVGSFSIYFSKILSAALFNFICHLLVMAILCPLLHLNFGGRNAGYVLALMLPIEFAGSALGVFFCCIFKNEETTSSLLSTAISILGILGGTFFSLDGLGSVLRTLTRFSPVKWMNDAFFALVFDGNRSVVLPLFLGGIAASLLLTLGCKIFFRTEDYLC